MDLSLPTFFASTAVSSCHLKLRVQSLFDWASLACAVGLAVATLGLPLPNSVRKAVSEWFPCRDCSCGCANAETCWRSCCCYSTGEKIALAAEHDVEPPAFLLARFAEEAKESNLPNLADLKPCCRTRVLESWNAEHAAQKTKSARTPTLSRTHSTSPTRTECSSNRLASQVAVSPLNCQGLSLSLLVLPPTVLSSDVLGLVERPPVAERIELLNADWKCLTQEPATPPPRLLG